MIIGLCGCMAQEESIAKMIRDKYPWIDIVLGTHNFYELPIYISKVLEDNKQEICVYSIEGNVIENIPTSRDSIILVINKVENPDELDERFSHFGMTDDFDEEENEEYDSEEESSSGLDTSEFVNCFEQLHDLLEESENKTKSNSAGEFVPLSETLQGGKKKTKKKDAEPINERIRVFSFPSLNQVMNLAHQIGDSYRGKNTLWKDPSTKQYYLLLHRGKGRNAFRLVCSTLSEYGTEETVTYATQTYYNEHFQLILKDEALTKLAEI